MEVDSGSGAASSGDRDAGPVAKRAKKTDHLELLPQEGRLVVYQPHASAVQVVMDQELLHKQSLPVGHWDIEYVDGYGCLIEMSSNGDGQVLLLEDWFGRQLWRSAESQELFVRDKSGAGHKCWSLTKRQEKFKDATVVGVCGDLRSPMTMQCYVLDWPRGNGCRFLWSLADVYRNLKLTTYNNTPSKWVFAKKVSFMERSGRLGGHGTHIFSGRLASHHERSPDPIEDFLPEPSATTSSFLDTLVRSATNTHRKGGFLDLKAKRKACILLEAVLRGAALWQPFKLQVSCEDSRVQWPREGVSVVHARLIVDSAGNVDLAELDTFRDSQHGFATSCVWLRELAKLDLADESGDVSLQTLLISIAGESDFENLYSQLIHWTARHVEKHLTLSLESPKPHPHALACERVDLLALLWDTRRLDFQLLKHLSSWAQTTRGKTRFSIALDEANIGGPTLHNSFIAQPDNSGYPGPPQVIDIDPSIFFKN